MTESRELANRRGNPRRRGALALVLALSIVLAGGITSCSGSEDLGIGGPERIDPTRSSTTEDLGGRSQFVGAAETVEQIQAIIDQLLASNDACAILTQKVVKGYQIDPTAFASPEVFARLSQGLVQVFDHLISITDQAIHDALAVEKEALGQVLDVVNSYIDNPTSPEARKKIEGIASAPTFIAASSQINDWTSKNCGGASTASQ